MPTDYARLQARRELLRIQAQREREAEEQLLDTDPSAFVLGLRCDRCGKPMSDKRVLSERPNEARVCEPCKAKMKRSER